MYVAQCIVLEVIRTDSMTLYCIVPNRNLQGVPKQLNRHPKVSEQNLLPQNMVWRTALGFDPTKTSHTESTVPNPTPGRQGGRGFPPTRPHTTAGGAGNGFPDHLGGGGGGPRSA